jgi:hypothetical protein
MTGKNDDSTYAREDSFLAELVPQVTEHLAAQHARDFDADAGQARFEAWLTAHTEEPPAAARAPDHADHVQPTGTKQRNRRVKPKRGLRSLASRHPLATGIAIATAVGAGAILAKAKWTRGTARVRDLVIRPGGWVVVEMDDHAVFIADPENLQRLQSAQQSGAPVPYWINNFKIIDGRPHGGIDGIGDTTRAMQFT